MNGQVPERTTLVGRLMGGLHRACSYWNQGISQLYWQVPLPIETSDSLTWTHLPLA